VQELKSHESKIAELGEAAMHSRGDQGRGRGQCCLPLTTAAWLPSRCCWSMAALS